MGVGTDDELAKTQDAMMRTAEPPADPVVSNVDNSPLQFITDNGWKNAAFPEHLILAMCQMGALRGQISRQGAFAGMSLPQS
jgi:hypothetical protein